jgi:hypothetical protein
MRPELQNRISNPGKVSLSKDEKNHTIISAELLKGQSVYVSTATFDAGTYINLTLNDII